MLIWFLMVIPIVAVLILSIFFQKKIALWEYLLVFGVPIIIIFVAKQSSIHYQTQDTEYWNSYLVSAEYYEYWSTWIIKPVQEKNVLELEKIGDVVP